MKKLLKIAIGANALLGSTALFGSIPTAVQAQDTPVVSTILAEIVVTAQRREQRLIEVTSSVSAFTGDDIQSRGIGDLSALQASIPGLRMVDIGPGQQRIQLRGVSQYQGLPTVGNYLDEFSLNNRSAQGVPEIRLLDIERVEVLRGPQPVLYGEGSMGGTIRYITKNPDLSSVSAVALAELNTVKGGEAGWRAEGIVNMPLAEDKVGLRIAATRDEDGGWIDGPLGRNANDRTTTTIRGKLLFTPSEALTISLLGLYNESEQDIKSYSFNGRDTLQINPSPSRQKYKLGNIEIGYDLGPVTLLSVTGYLNQDSRSVDDSTSFYQTLFGGPLLEDALTDAIGEMDKWSQEFRLTSNGDGPLQYLLGLSYTHSKTDGVTYGTGVSLIPGLPAGSLGLEFDLASKTKSKIWAFFGNVSYKLNDSLTFEAGGRYFRDKVVAGDASIFYDLGGPGVDIITPLTYKDASFESFNPRASLSLDTGSSGIVYISAAKGYRSGGFNGAAAGLPGVSPTIEPEKLWTYEIGSKQSLFDNKVYLEVSAYYNDYTNIQLNQFVPAMPGRAFVQNGGKASGPGVDFILQAALQDDLRLSLTAGWNRLRFDTDSADKLKGDPADLVPDWNLSASFDYEPRLTDSTTLIVHADIGYVDKAQIILRSLTGSGLNAVAPSNSRTTANVRLGARYENFETYIYANNLFNTLKIVNPAFGAFFEPIYTQPRTIGIGAKAAF